MVDLAVFLGYSQRLTGRVGEGPDDREPPLLDRSEALRREVQEALNVVEQWNGTNGFIFYGKGGEVATGATET